MNSNGFVYRSAKQSSIEQCGGATRVVLQRLFDKHPARFAQQTRSHVQQEMMCDLPCELASMFLAHNGASLRVLRRENRATLLHLRATSSVRERIAQVLGMDVESSHSCWITSDDNDDDDDQCLIDWIFLHNKHLMLSESSTIVETKTSPPPPPPTTTTSTSSTVSSKNQYVIVDGRLIEKESALYGILHEIIIKQLSDFDSSRRRIHHISNNTTYIVSLIGGIDNKTKLRNINNYQKLKNQCKTKLSKALSKSLDSNDTNDFNDNVLTPTNENNNNEKDFEEYFNQTNNHNLLYYDYHHDHRHQQQQQQPYHQSFEDYCNDSLNVVLRREQQPLQEHRHQHQLEETIRVLHSDLNQLFVVGQVIEKFIIAFAISRRLLLAFDQVYYYYFHFFQFCSFQFFKHFSMLLMSEYVWKRWNVNYLAKMVAVVYRHNNVAC